MLKNDVIVPGNAWPIEDTTEQERLKRISENEILFRGKLEEIHPLWYQRVTKNWPQSVPALVAANFYKPITLLCADLLYGEQGELVGIKCNNSKTMQAVQRIIETNRFSAIVYEVGGLAASYRKDGLYSIEFDDITKQVRIYPQPANFWFPVVDQANVKKVKQHIIAWPERHGNRWYLRKDVHEPGVVYHFAYELTGIVSDPKNSNSIDKTKPGKIRRQVHLSELGLDIPEQVETRIDRPLIVHCPNWSVDNDIYGVDDYEDLDTLIYELAIMLSRNSMVLAKHTDPNMCGDPSCLQQDEKGNYILPVGGAFFPYQEGSAKPEYLTWDGKLEAAEKQIDRLIELIFYISETSPAAFGMDKVSSTESGTALKKRLMRTIAKVNRKKLYADPAIKDVIEIAQMLDVEWGGGKYEVERPTIEWADGLPDDPKEEAEIVGMRIKDGTLSQLDAIMMLDKCDEETARKKLEQIQAERNAALPGFARSGQIGNFPENPFRRQEAGEEGAEGAGVEGGGQ